MLPWPMVSGDPRLAAVVHGVFLEPVKRDDCTEVNVFGLNWQREVRAQHQVALTLDPLRDLSSQGRGLGSGQSKQDCCFVLAHQKAVALKHVNDDARLGDGLSDLVAVVKGPLEEVIVCIAHLMLPAPIGAQPLLKKMSQVDYHTIPQ